MRNLLFLLMVIALMFTGCWDARDVDDLFIPFVGGYDLIKSEEGEIYSLTINFPILSRNAKEKSDVMSVEGETIAATRIDRANKSSRGMAIGDVKVILFGEELADRGLRDVVDILFRDPRFSETILLAVSEGRTKDILTMKPQNYQTVGQNILDLLRNSPRDYFVPREQLHQFRVNTLTDGFNTVLPVIGMHDKNKLEISGAALFKRYKMVAKISPREMAALIWLRGQKGYGDILYSFNDAEGKPQKVTFEGQNSRSVKARLVEGKPFFEITIKMDGHIAESLEGIVFAGEEENVEIAAKALEEEITRRCEDLIFDLQNSYRVDSILMGKYARAKWPELVKDGEWDEFFCQSKIKVKVKVNIQSTGEVA